MRDEATFRRDVAAIKSAKLQTCVKDVFTKVLTTQLGAPTSVEVSSLDVPEHGDVTTGIRLTAKGITGSTETVYFDLVLMGKNRVEATASLFSAGQPIDPALEKTLVDAMGARVDAS